MKNKIKGFLVYSDAVNKICNIIHRNITENGGLGFSNEKELVCYSAELVNFYNKEFLNSHPKKKAMSEADCVALQNKLITKLLELGAKTDFIADEDSVCMITDVCLDLLKTTLKLKK